MNNLIYHLFNKNRKKVKRPKIITLCGSTVFKDEFIKVRKELESKGYTVIGPHIFSHADGVELTEREIELLTQFQLERIDISDEIYIINPNGYIGDGTWKEIKYAIDKRKSLTYYFPISINNMYPNIINR